MNNISNSDNDNIIIINDDNNDDNDNILTPPPPPFGWPRKACPRPCSVALVIPDWPGSAALQASEKGEVLLYYSVLH